MDRVGVVTLFRNNSNYGAVMQAYALQRVIEKMGCDVELIDIDFQSRRKRSIFYLLADKAFPAGPTARLYLSWIKIYKFALFQPKNWEMLRIAKKLHNRGMLVSKFKQNTIRTSGPYRPEELPAANERYDIFIAGSDQIWNPTYWKQPFFLDFVAAGKRKASYAASIGRSSLTEEEKVIFKEKLKDFAYISVRENEGKLLLEPVLGREVTVVLDPTLLLTGREWEKLEEPIHIGRDYLLCCFLGESREHRLFARKVAARLGMKCALIMTGTMEVNVGSGLADVELIDVSPGQFLTLIKNAGMVLTDSFHFTVFSIIYRKNFYVMKRNKDTDVANMNARLYTLLGNLALMDRWIDEFVYRQRFTMAWMKNSMR